MRRLLLLIIIAVAAWFAWKHYGNPFLKQPSHEAVIENASGREMVSVRLRVDGQTFVKESIPDEAKVPFSFRVKADASFQLIWSWAQSPGELTWSGGYVPRGPMQQRHVLTVDGDGNVLYRAENK